MDAFATIRLAGLTAIERNGQATNSLVVAPTQDVEIPDDTLMAEICNGSREALAILFGRYARLVRTVAMRILRDGSEADDLLQEVFLFIHRNCSVFDSSKSGLRSWIVQMTYHRAIDKRRYLQSRHFYSHVEVDGTIDVPDPNSLGREEHDCSFEDMVGNTTIQRLLDTLSADQRNTLNLHFYEGYTFAEIAIKLDQSLGNIRNHYYRGLDRLRKQMFSGKLPGHNGYGRK